MAYKPTNVRLAIQAESVPLLLESLNALRKTFGEEIAHETEIRQNTRVPFPKGVHCVIYLALPEVTA